jgi:hypothetical protein
MDDEMIIFSTSTGIYYGLDPVGAFVWKQIQSSALVSDVLSALLNRYDVPEDVCKRDLLALLTDLAANNLVESDL